MITLINETLFDNSYTTDMDFCKLKNEDENTPFKNSRYKAFGYNLICYCNQCLSWNENIVGHCGFPINPTWILLSSYDSKMTCTGYVIKNTIKESFSEITEHVWNIIIRCILFDNLYDDCGYCLYDCGYKLNDGCRIIYEFNNGDNVNPILPKDIENWINNQDRPFPVINKWYLFTKETVKQIVNIGIENKHGFENQYSKYIKNWYDDVFLIEAILQTVLYGKLKYVNS